MSEPLSREQVERLGSAIHAIPEHRGWRPTWGTSDHLAAALAPTVAAMLEERDREARAEVVRDVEALVEEHGTEDGHHIDFLVPVHHLHATLARHASGAAGAPLTDERMSGGAGVPDEAAGAAEGRTGPQARIEE